MIKSASAIAANLGVDLVDDRDFSSNPADGYLGFVLCRRGDEYITWLWNKSDDAFYEGHYGMSQSEGMSDFINRR